MRMAQANGKGGGGAAPAKPAPRPEGGGQMTREEALKENLKAEADLGAHWGGGSEAVLVLQAIRNIMSEYLPEKATQRVIEETCSLLNTDRATLFMMDDEGEHLLVKLAKGKAPLKLPLGKGIAGHVANTGEVLVVDDAQSHALFDSSNDKRTGYHTANMLVLPALDTSGNVTGVLQCVNKLPQGTRFRDKDVALAANLAHVGSLCLRNCIMMEELRYSQRRSAALVDLVRTLGQKMDTASSFMFTVCRRTADLMEAEGATFWVRDAAKGCVHWTDAQGTQAQAPLADVGALAEVVSGGKALLINDGGPDNDLVAKDRYLMGRHEQDPDTVRTILCAPICPPRSSEPSGALLILNKEGGREFSKEDKEILMQICDLVGTRAEPDQLLDVFSRTGRKSSISAADEADPRAASFSKGRQRRNSLQGTSLIEEGDEEEED